MIADVARCARWQRALRNLLVSLAVLGCTTSAASAEVRTEHGSSDVYAAPGIGIVWAIERSASEADATVVIRIAADPAMYPWLAVRGVNPFTKGENVLLQPTVVERSVDLRIPRARFADHPKTEVGLYATQDAARSGAATLTVFYLGVPDTTPEFVDRAKLEASLTERMARARAAKGPQ
jgi:hypothetical protein